MSSADSVSRSRIDPLPTARSGDGVEAADVPERADVSGFAPINRGYARVFHPDRLSVGLVVPLEAYPHGPVPTMTRHLERARLADELGYAALWLRDVPFDVPAFGDVGQTYDPFVYLGVLAATTERIALGFASLVLPLRHPAHVAKAAATADVLSGGRLLLGIASGDRPEEYPALDVPFNERGVLLRESVDYVRRMSETFPVVENAFGRLGGDMDLLPKPAGARLPLLVTGGSRQAPDWTARHADGWMTYPRELGMQTTIVRNWRARVEAAGEPAKPVMQPLYVDLADDPSTPPQPIHLGFRAGAHYSSRPPRGARGTGRQPRRAEPALQPGGPRGHARAARERCPADLFPKPRMSETRTMRKTILITGATSGIGLETARMLVSVGQHVLLHGRSPKKLEDAATTLAASTGNGHVERYSADLSNLHEVNALADAVAHRHDTLDVLINNAGVYGTTDPVTRDGLDVRFAVNTIAPWILTRRLLGMAGGRAVSSRADTRTPAAEPV